MEKNMITKILLSSFILSSLAGFVEPCHPSDYKALLDIQEAMGGTPDLVFSFNLATNCCAGWAIKCDSNGRVISFQATNGNRSTQIPSSISLLEYLQELIFEYSPIFGSIPRSVTKLKYLTFLNICGTNLNSTIPSFLGRMTSLQYIDLNSNSLQGTIPVSLGNLTNLRDLYLDGNMLSGPIPATLGRNLQILALSDNQLTGPVPRSFSNMSSLDYIDLSFNQLSGDASHLFVTNVFNLDLEFNLFKFDFSTVNFKLGLTNFYMSYNQVFGGFPPSISSPVFRGFDVSYNQLCGPIPSGRSLQQFGASSFAHNLCLCDSPLPPCSGF